MSKQNEWIKWEGFDKVVASHVSVVAILLEDRDGFRTIDSLAYRNFKWTFLGDLHGRNIIAYYAMDKLEMCCIRMTEHVQEFEQYSNRREVLVLWGYSYLPGETELRFDYIYDGGFSYRVNGSAVQTPDYALGYHVMPDRYSYINE